MKIQKLFSLTRKMRPTPLDDDMLLMWLNEIEGLIQVEVLLRAAADVSPYEVNQETGELPQADLLVPYPYDKLYLQYLVAQIDYFNGEYDRYQNTMQMFNTYYTEYVHYVAEVIAPVDGRPHRLQYYLTAYGIAVKHGYGGTEEAWLQSLKGDVGERGTQVLVAKDNMPDIGETKTSSVRDLSSDSVKVGDVVVGANGALAKVVSISEDGESYDAVGAGVNLTGPTGEQGETGHRGAQIIPALVDDMPEYEEEEAFATADLPEGCNVAVGDTIIGRNGMLAIVTYAGSGGYRVVGVGTNLTGSPGIGLPTVTAADNGKILIVANGQWTLEQTIDAAGVMV